MKKEAKIGQELTAESRQTNTRFPTCRIQPISGKHPCLKTGCPYQRSRLTNSGNGSHFDGILTEYAHNSS
ncbi:MAG TPA: hypothetical protein DEB39_11670 [Planctomycetaceae bacterium]|nr:hypothetical protein [Planctomycetaceae bacterium]